MNRSKKIRSLKQFLKARRCGETDFSQVERATYKYSDCGAWIAQDEEGIKVGSIVEGVDEGTETHKLNYPFQIEDFWDALKAVEEEAAQIWNDTHGCEDCGEPEWGMYTRAINPDCQTCKGEGTIL